MIKIAALNASSSDEENTSLSVHKIATKEAQESEAFALYNKALGYQRQGEHQKAEDVFHDLLEMPFVNEAEPTDDNIEAIMQPCLVLKYSICKNLASLYSQRKDYETAMEHYLEAVMVDSSDVSVWFQIGQIALKLVNYPLARHAFEQGLQSSPKHWPCLDKVITILFVLGNYYACLCYVAVALEKDPGYVKGLVFLRQIFTEQPSLKKQTEELFSKCDSEIYETTLEQDEMEEFYGEAVEMRKTRRELLKPTPLPVVPIKIPMKQEFTWLNLGRSLVHTYDYIAKQVPDLSLSCRVDISPYLSVDNAPVAEKPEESAENNKEKEKETDEAAESTVKESAETVAMETSEIEEPKQPDEAVMADEEGTNDLHQFESRSNTPVNPFQVEDSASAKKGHKRKRSLLEELGGKRRSARVRNIPKSKPEETMNYHEILLRILPMTLLQVVESEETDSFLESPGEEDAANNEPQAELPRRPSEGCFIRATEVQDILAFAKRLEKNSGVISLLNEFLIWVANQATHKWDDSMVQVFIDGFSRVRKHIEFPGYLCKDTPDERIKDMALLCLVQAELYVDKWLFSKPKNSPRKSGPAGQVSSKEAMSSFFMEDLSYTEGVSICQSILQPDWLTYCVRASWLHAQFHMLEGDLDLASGYFDRTNMYLTIGEQEQGAPVVVKIPNCKVDSFISQEEVNKQLDSLRRFQSFEDMQRLYEQGSYEEVVTLLLQTFTNKGAKHKLMKMSQQERHTQLLLLQDSLLKLEDYKRGIIWGEVCFDEALLAYQNTTARAEKEEWSTAMVQLLQGISKCLEEKLANVRELVSRNLVRLTQNIIKVIDLALDVADNASDLVIPTMVPWIVLYRLVLHEEQRGIEAAEEEGTLPANLMLLQVAHDYLGGRGLCVCCNGTLLLFVIDILLKELAEDTPDSAHPFKVEIEQHIEQCFYCLFGHPNKRRAKNMQDHTSNQLTLTWERAKLLFNYFKPKSMPEFDSLKINTVSSDLEGLLRRILGIVPSSHKSILTVRTDKLTNFMDGFSNDPPAFPDVEDQDIVIELFYLLGDYYFKNKEQAKATKYYQQDLCFNPERFDSWAGVALARASKLEQKLNAHELKWEAKSEGATWKQAIAALRCFKRALELDSSNSKLWIEYGSLAYLLHSYASRQLKFQTWYPLGDETLDTAKTNKVEMLKIAQNCYQKASECDGEDNEEQWLSHYMLGKVAEKMKKHPGEFLEHYKLAAHYLHEDKAKYPKKITYVLSPPHLAVESLEVYYRLHVSIVKFTFEHMEKPEKVPFDLFTKYLEGAATSPFALGCEKRRDTTDLDDAPDANGTPRSKKSVDHNYFRRQSSDSGARSDEGSQENGGRREVINQRTLVSVLMSDSAESQSPVQRSLTSSPAHSLGAGSLPSTSANNGITSTVVSTSATTVTLTKESTGAATSSTSEVSDTKTSAVGSDSTKTNESVAMDIGQNDVGSTSSVTEKSAATATSTSETPSEAKSEDKDTKMDTDVLVQPSVDDTQSEVKSLSPTNQLIHDIVSISSTAAASPTTSAVTSTETGATVTSSAVVDKPVSVVSPTEEDGNIASIVSTTGGPIINADARVSSTSEPTVNAGTVATTTPSTHSAVVASTDSRGPTTDSRGPTTDSRGPTTDSKAPVAARKPSPFSMASILGEDSQSSEASRQFPGAPILVPYSSQSSVESQLSETAKEVSAITEGKAVKGDVVTVADDAENGGEHDRNATEGMDGDSDVKMEIKDEVSDNILDVPKTDAGKEESRSEDASNVGIAESDISILDGTMKAESDQIKDESEKDKEDSFNEDLPERRKSALDDEESKRVIAEAAQSLMFLAGSIGAESHLPTFPEFPDAFDEGEGKDDDPESPDLEPPQLEPELPLLPRERISPESSQDSAEEALERLKSEILFLNESAPQPPPLPDIAAWRSEESGRESEDEKKTERRPSVPSTIYEDPPIITKEVKDEPDGVGNQSKDQIDQSGEKTVLSMAEDIEEHMRSLQEKIDSLTSERNDLERSEGQHEEIQKEADGIDTMTEQKDSKESSEKSMDATDGSKRVQDKAETSVTKDEADMALDPVTGDLVLKGLQGMETYDAEKEKAETVMDLTKDLDKEADSLKSKMESSEKRESGNQPEAMETETVEKDKETSRTTETDADKNKPTAETKDGETDDKQQKGKENKTDDKKITDKENTGKGNEMEKAKDSTTDKGSNTKIEKVLRDCLKAFNLCLSRFPQHYKSYYRLAHAHYYCAPVKNLTFAGDLLIGNPAWQTLSHMPGPGLFGERKPTNFFQGLWKIPSEDIDRAGSFASHLTRSIVLLLEVLRDLDDALSLFQVHMQLTRIPDQGKKYLRDNDRSVLASQSYSFCLDALEQKMMPRARSQVRQVKIAYMMECYKIWQYGVKLSQSADRVNVILVNAFAECFKDKISGELSVMDQAIAFCQHQQQLQGQTTPTGETSKSFPGPAPIERSRLSTDKAAKSSDKKAAKIFERGVSREGESLGSSLQTSPVKGAASSTSGLKMLGKSASLQEKLSSIVGRSLSVGPSTSKGSPSKGVKHSSPTQGGAPAKVRKVDSPDRHRDAALGLNSAMMAQLGSQLSAHMQQLVPPGGMTPAIATQLSYYYSSITGLDPNTVWMSMMMGQYMQEDAITKAVSTAVKSRGSSSSSSPQKGGAKGSPVKGTSTKTHSPSPKPSTSDKSGVRYIQTTKGLVQIRSPKPATVTSSSQGRSLLTSAAQPPPAHSHSKPAQGTSASFMVTPKPAHSNPSTSHEGSKHKPTHGGLAQVRVDASLASKSGVKQKSKKKLGQQHESLLKSIMTSPMYLNLQAKAQAKINQIRRRENAKSSAAKPEGASRTPTAQFSASVSSAASPGVVLTPSPRPQTSGSTSTVSVFQTPTSTQPTSSRVSSDSDVIILSESESD